MKTQAQAAAEKEAFRILASEDWARPKSEGRPSIDIATLRDRIEARQPGRTTHFGGDLIYRAPSRKLSIEVQDASLVSVLRAFAEVAKTNLVVGDEVKGRVTLKLRNVPWDRALLVLCEAKGLHASWEGNILHVRPLRSGG